MESAHLFFSCDPGSVFVSSSSSYNGCLSLWEMFLDCSGLWVSFRLLCFGWLLFWYTRCSRSLFVEFLSWSYGRRRVVYDPKYLPDNVCPSEWSVVFCCWLCTCLFSQYCKPFLSELQQCYSRTGEFFGHMGLATSRVQCLRWVYGRLNVGNYLLLA